MLVKLEATITSKQFIDQKSTGGQKGVFLEVARGLCSHPCQSKGLVPTIQGEGPLGEWRKEGGQPFI